jgi:hypothetical protein
MYAKKIWTIGAIENPMYGAPFSAFPRIIFEGKNCEEWLKTPTPPNTQLYSL